MKADISVYVRWRIISGMMDDGTRIWVENEQHIPDAPLFIECDRRKAATIDAKILDAYKHFEKEVDAILGEAV